jgi:hypothetical protein
MSVDLHARHLRSLLTLLTHAAAIIILSGGLSLAASKDQVRQRANDAIDTIRGGDVRSLTDEEKESLSNTLDEAWKIILDKPKVSKPLVRSALAREKTDDVRIIDLTHLLLVLDSGLLEEAAAALSRADLNAFPEGSFFAIVLMAANHCRPCLPTVIKMLEMEELDTGIAQHALPVDLELGLIFTVAQYGDDIVAQVRDGLRSDNCVIRGNAAFALGILLPRVHPVAIRKIAMQDTCLGARTKAWKSLGLLDDPALARLAGERLEESPAPDRRERLAIVEALSLAFVRTVLKPLERLTKDKDKEVATAAKRAVQSIKEEAPSLAYLRVNAGSAPPTTRSKILKHLRKAAKNGRFEFEGDRRQLIAAVTVDDLQLLNSARAAVLNRVSDECLYEYFDLTYTARAVRSVGKKGSDES